MWSETVGLRTRPVWDQKKIGLGLGLARCGLGLGLTGLVLCCETRSCHARRHNDLEGHRSLSSTIYSISVLVLEHHYCGDQQWRSLTLKLNPPSTFFTSDGLGLGLVSSGLGLGLKNLVLFTSLALLLQNSVYTRNVQSITCKGRLFTAIKKRWNGNGRVIFTTQFWKPPKNF